MQPDHIPDQQVTIPQAADLFPVSRSQLYRWAADLVIIPVATVRSPGCKRQTSYFHLSEIAAVVAARHAERDAAPADRGDR